MDTNENSKHFFKQYEVPKKDDKLLLLWLMQSGERKDVYKVYNKIAIWFSENRYSGLMEKSYPDELISHTPAYGTVLDLGCGNEKPILDYLVSKDLCVTDVDAIIAWHSFFHLPAV